MATTPADLDAPIADVPIEVRTQRAPADRAFRAIALAAGSSTLVLMGLIGVFLLTESVDALRSTGLGFLTEARWSPESGRIGMLSIAIGTVLIAAIAVTLAVPVAIGSALYITDYAPRPVAGVLTTLVDLLAAVPSLIYGLWGRSFLQPRQIGLSRWLDDHLGFIPFLDADTPSYAASTFIAGTVVAIMILPICTSVMREVFSQAPPGEKEGVLALGGTRWGMVRTVVLPFGAGGIIGGSMLGLGRALGETIAVTLIISPKFDPIGLFHIVELGGNSVAANIALRFGEATEFGLSGLMASGLVLFAVTLLVNFLASLIVSRSRSGAAVEI